jgi:sensor histidine kinase YesM
MTSLFKKYSEWNAERISRHILYWLIWSLFYIVVNSLVNQETFWQYAAFETIVLPVKIGFSYLVAYYFLPKFLYTKQYVKFVICVLIAALIFGILLFLVHVEIVYPYILKLNMDNYYSWYGKFIFKAVELIHISSLVACIKFFQNNISQEKENANLKAAKTKAELLYLKNQIQPHFLFNTLNNIYGMVLSNDKKTGESIVKLSDMLSYMLYESNDEKVPLDKEIKHLENFLELEQLRYDRKLNVVYKKENLQQSAQIPPNLLIPFVENAFKHGPAKEEENSEIFIEIKMEDQKFRFTIENTFEETPTDDKIKSGIGVDNVQKRLAYLYPNSHELKITKGDKFKVELNIDDLNE